MNSLEVDEQIPVETPGIRKDTLLRSAGATAVIPRHDYASIVEQVEFYLRPANCRVLQQQGRT